LNVVEVVKLDRVDAVVGWIEDEDNGYLEHRFRRTACGRDLFAIGVISLGERLNIDMDERRELKIRELALDVGQFVISPSLISFGC